MKYSITKKTLKNSKTKTKQTDDPENSRHQQHKDKVAILRKQQEKEWEQEKQEYWK